MKPAPRAKSDRHLLRASVQSLKILVVDDHEQVRELLKAFLAIDEHLAEFAVDGKDGLSRFVSGQFDVVITDRAMPQMSGDQLAVALKAHAPASRVILLTGFGEFIDASAERPAGVDLVLSKRVTLSALRVALSTVSRR